MMASVTDSILENPLENPRIYGDLNASCFYCGQSANIETIGHITCKNCGTVQGRVLSFDPLFFTAHGGTVREYSYISNFPLDINQSDYRVRIARAKILHIASILNSVSQVSQAVVERVESHFNRLVETLEGRPSSPVIAALFIYYLRKVGVLVKPNDIINKLSAHRYQVTSRNVRKIMREYDLKVPIVKTVDFIPLSLNKLHLGLNGRITSRMNKVGISTENIQPLVYQLSIYAEQLIGKSPRSFYPQCEAGTIIYLVFKSIRAQFGTRILVTLENITTHLDISKTAVSTQIQSFYGEWYKENESRLFAKTNEILGEDLGEVLGL